MASQLITLGQMFDQTWDLYKAHFKTFVKVTAWFFAISFFVILGSLFAPVGNAQFFIEQGLLTPGHYLGLVLPIFAQTILLSVITVWVFLMLVGLTHAFQQTKKADVKRINAASWKLFFPFALMSFVRVLLFLLPLLAIVPGLVLILLSLKMSGIGFSAFAILLMLVGAFTGLVLLVLFWVWFAFPGYAMVIDGKGAVDSLRVSKSLIRGRFFAVFIRLLVPKIVFSFFIIIAQVILYVVFTVLIINPAMAPETFVRLSDAIGHLTLTGITVLTLPLYMIADYYLYQSLKER